MSTKASLDLILERASKSKEFSVTEMALNQSKFLHKTSNKLASSPVSPRYKTY